MELKDIERSIIKKYKSTIFGKFLKTVKEYNLISDGDVVGVCISGGKDSFLLAKCMQELQRHSKYHFDIKFICMNPGYKEENILKIKENAEILGIDLYMYDSNIFEMIKDSSSPCYLCARKRRGSLYDHAKELGCNKIALGHHFDDVIETILLNILYAGEYKTMMPKLKADNFSDMELIRPLYMVKESDIISWSKYNDLSFIDCACNVTKKDLGKRLEIKQLIKQLKEINPNVDINILRSSNNINIDSVLGYKIKNKDKYVSFLDNYDK